MEKELEDLQNKMKSDINEIKEKYKNLKLEVRNKYKKVNTKRRSIPKTLKDNVWNNAFTERNGVGQCFVCKGKITSRSFDCGHIVSVAKGGTDQLSNLKPVCSTCNKSMGTQNMMGFKEEFFKETHGRRTRAEAMAYAQSQGRQTLTLAELEKNNFFV